VFSLTGTASTDNLVNAGANVIFGLGGDDVISGGKQGGFIFGGAGTDTALFDGIAANHRIQLVDGETVKIVVADKRPGEGGTDTLTSVERLQFTDGFSFDAEGREFVDTTLLAGVLDITPEELTRFVEMYIAYFDRAPDAMGIYYWGSRLADGMLIEEIANSFYVQPESRAIYTDPDHNAALVDAVYRNLLERESEQVGRDYWINALEQGDVSRGEAVLAIINGAKAESGSVEDAKVIEDKGKIGLSYAAINGLTDVNNAKTAMAAYERGDAEASLAEAERLIDAFRDAAENPSSNELIVELVGFVDDPFAVA
jgi:Ca2+-binding RTX toxin-like protein